MSVIFSAWLDQIRRSLGFGRPLAARLLLRGSHALRRKPIAKNRTRLDLERLEDRLVPSGGNNNYNNNQSQTDLTYY